MVIWPFGKHLEAEKHDIKTILIALQDVIEAIKFTYDKKILHYDIFFGNVILF